MRKTLIIVMLSVILLLFIVGCSSSSSKKSNNYSDEYNSNKKYKDNVDHIVDSFGKDSGYVDRYLNGLADAMK